MIALTNYGVATTDAISLTARSGQTIDKGTGQPVYFAGLTSSGGHPIAWTGRSVYRSQESLGQAGAYSWYPVGTGGASVLSADIEVQGTSGTVAAVIASSSSGPFGVQLWPFDAGGPASGGSSASFAGFPPALRFVGGSLFVAGGAPPVLARYQPPSLTAAASTPLLAPTGFTIGRPVGVWPSGSSVLASALETYSNGSVAEFQTAWPATGPSVLARAGYASEGLIAVSPDGRAWFGLTRATGLDLQPGLAEGLYQTTANSVAIRDVGRVDLPARGGLAVPSLSGHRLYVTLPSIDAIAVIE